MLRGPLGLRGRGLAGAGAAGCGGEACLVSAGCGSEGGPGERDGMDVEGSAAGSAASFAAACRWTWHQLAG